MADFEDIHGNTLTRADHRYEVLTGDTDLDYAAWVAERLDREPLPRPAPITGPPIPFEVIQRGRAIAEGARPVTEAVTLRGSVDSPGLADWPAIAHVGMFFATGGFWLIPMLVAKGKRARVAETNDRFGA